MHDVPHAGGGSSSGKELAGDLSTIEMIKAKHSKADSPGHDLLQTEYTSITPQSVSYAKQYTQDTTLVQACRSHCSQTVG
eukprot:72647-Rhodomonas_salina.1